MALLSVKNLKTYFKTEDGIAKAVDDVSFSLEDGETLGIVGESGSGKSVTSLSILRLVPQPPGYYAGGEILFEGRDLLRASESEMFHIRGDRISMIFQDPMTSLNPFLTVERQLTEVLEEHKGLEGKPAKNKCIEMLERVGIPSPERRIGQYPHQFSGGMRQRVMIAMALLCEPKLLIADEPTTALDVTIQAQILGLINELKRDFGTSVILITHDLGVVAGMADRVEVMYAGKIIEEAPVSTLYSDPAHPYTRGLLDSVPRLNETRLEKLVPIPGLPPDMSRLPSGCTFHPRCGDMIPEICPKKYPDVFHRDATHWGACWAMPEAKCESGVSK